MLSHVFGRRGRQIGRHYRTLVVAATVLLGVASGLTLGWSGAAAATPGGYYPSIRTLTDGDPVVTGVSPVNGPAAGGTQVTITGSAFTGTTAVHFGTVEATYNSDSLTDTTIVATSPAHAAGLVNVTVTTGDGTSTTSMASQFTYLPNEDPAFTDAAANTEQTISVGDPLDAVVAADGDEDTLTYSLSTGTVPAGITLEDDGSFTGEATTAGDTTAHITVEDGNGGTDETTLVVHVLTGPTLDIYGGDQVSVGNAAPPIAGTTDAPDGSTVTVTIRQQALLDGHQTETATVQDGKWTVTPDPRLADDAQYTVKAKVVDADTQASATDEQTLIIDPTLSQSEFTSAVGPAIQHIDVDVPAGGTLTLVDLDGFEVPQIVIDGRGTYSADQDAEQVTFTPTIGVAGDVGAITFRVTNSDGESVDRGYALMVLEPPVPTAPALETSAAGGQSVTVTVPPAGSVTLLDPASHAVTSWTIPDVGSYTLVGGQAPVAAPAAAQVRAVGPTSSTATITFTPVDSFAGTAPAVRYRITDSFGQSAIGQYTATVTGGAAIPVTGSPVARTALVGVVLIALGAVFLAPRRRSWLRLKASSLPLKARWRGLTGRA